MPPCPSRIGPICSFVRFSFFFNDTAPTEIYTLSLHDALPISPSPCFRASTPRRRHPRGAASWRTRDRKSTRLNSSHVKISYAVLCLTKKNTVVMGDAGIKSKIKGSNVTQPDEAD